MPNPKAQYMRASIVDLMPDPLSPLFETLGLASIERGINTMAEDLFNFPEGLLSGFMMTINGYAYQQVSFTPRQWWTLISRMVPRFPYMLREGVPYWREVAQPRYAKKVAHWEEKSLQDLTPEELLSGIYDVLGAFAHHLGALMASTMGPSAGSETLFTNVYRRLVKQEDDPDAPAFLMGFDSIPIKSEKALYDLALWCRQHENLSAYLKETPAEQILRKLAGPLPPEGVDLDVWEEWQRRFRAYLEAYGYSIYDMDFVKPLPMDEPGPILEMLKLFISGQGKSPYQRQAAYEERRERAVEEVRSRLKGIKRWAFEKTLNWAQSLAPLREDGIAEIGFGYPLLHQLLGELGRRFADAGAVEQADDIYWLKESEVKGLVTALERGEHLENTAETVHERRALWRARKRATPPPQLPAGKKYMGFDMEGVLAGGEGGLEGNTIKGVAASPGQVTAPARVLHGPEDFDQMKPGDILVAGITTPAWTPLFAMAAGVVTDIGGPLSHGSIVAREYGIPAVLGTGIATKSIHSGQTIAVDGSNGTVTITNGEGPA
jgi:pyruvate,water dikinase